MTTLVDERVDKEEDEVVETGNPIPCHDLSIEGDCNNAAVLMTRPKCCNLKVPLCDDCFFTFVEWSKRCHETNPNWKLACNYCGTVSILEPNYLVVLWRI